MLPFVMELFRGTITPGLSVMIILLSMVSFFFRGRHGDVNFQKRVLLNSRYIHISGTEL